MAPLSEDHPWARPIDIDKLVAENKEKFDSTRRVSPSVVRVPAYIRNLKPHIYDASFLPMGLLCNQNVKNASSVYHLKLEVLSCFLEFLQVDQDGWKTFCKEIATQSSSSNIPDVEYFYENDGSYSHLPLESIQSILVTDAFFIIAVFIFTTRYAVGKWKKWNERPRFVRRILDILDSGSVQINIHTCIGDIFCLFEGQIPLFLVKNAWERVASAPGANLFSFDRVLRDNLSCTEASYCLPGLNASSCKDIEFDTCDHLLACMQKMLANVDDDDGSTESDEDPNVPFWPWGPPHQEGRMESDENKKAMEQAGYVYLDDGVDPNGPCWVLHVDGEEVSAESGGEEGSTESDEGLVSLFREDKKDEENVDDEEVSTEPDEDTNVDSEKASTETESDHEREVQFCHGVQFREASTETESDHEGEVQFCHGVQFRVAASVYQRDRKKGKGKKNEENVNSEEGSTESERKVQFRVAFHGRDREKGEGKKGEEASTVQEEGSFKSYICKLPVSRKILEFLEKLATVMSKVLVRPPKDVRKSLPPASQLAKTGIRFKGADMALGDLRFVKSFFRLSAVLHLPHIPELDNFTEKVLLNMMMYESVNKKEKGVHKYVFLMDELIATEEDVEVLMDGEDPVIVENLLGGNKQVVDVFTDPARNMTFEYGESYQQFLDIRNEIIVWYSDPWRRRLVQFLDSYRLAPWLLVISLLAATFLVGLTVIQTVYTVWGFYKS